MTVQASGHILMLHWDATGVVRGIGVKASPGSHAGVGMAKSIVAILSSSELFWAEYLTGMSQCLGYMMALKYCFFAEELKSAEHKKIITVSPLKPRQAASMGYTQDVNGESQKKKR